MWLNITLLIPRLLLGKWLLESNFDRCNVFWRNEGLAHDGVC